MMKTLHIAVVNKVATYTRRDGAIVCGNKDYQIEFVFDSEWDGINTKTARFVWGGAYYDQEFTGTICRVPMIVGTDSVLVGVYAGDLETTTPAVIPCQRSILCATDAPHPESGQNYSSEAKAAAERAEAAAADLFEADGRVAVLEAEVSKQDKRITNLEQNITPNPFVTDSSMAYQKDVPAGALPYAALERVGGMTHKSENLILYPYYYSSRTAAGITYEVDADGVITINGTATANSIFVIAQNQPFSAGSYFLSGCPKNGSTSTFAVYAVIKDSGAYKFDTGNGVAITLAQDTEVTISFIVYSGTTMTNAKVYPMLNLGSAALPFEPYLEGMHHTSVKALEIEGANLARMTNGTHSVLDTRAVVEIEDGTVKLVLRDYGEMEITAGKFQPFTLFKLPAGTYTATLSSSNGIPPNMSFVTVQFRNVTDDKHILQANAGASANQTFTLTKDTDVAVAFYLWNGTGKVCDYYETIVKLMLVRGETAMPFAPYHEKDTFVPPVIDEQGGERVEGWGLGISEDCYNYYDFEGNRYVQECRLREYREGDESNPDVVTDGTETVYKLDEPEITEMPPTDNLIRVEAGGKITFVNEHQMAAPSTITYQIKEGTA